VASRPEGETYDERVELGRLLNEAIERKRQAEADRIVARLREKAVDIDVHNLLSESMVLNAGFLVDRAAVDAFDEAVNELAAEAGERLTFKYVGPLPPYSFVKVAVPEEA
jgi:hypothetical protein